MLSKSKYIKGLQCDKRLWLDKHKPDLKEEISEAQQALFSQGTRVGELAQLLFPGGVDASKDVDLQNNFSQWLINTERAIQEGQKIIYEAAFNSGGTFSAMDILIKEEKGWRAIEVKSSTSVKDYHIDDAAVQYFVLKRSGLTITDIEIMHINNQYVRQGELDLNALFKSESVLDRILPMQDDIPSKMLHFTRILRSPNEPVKDIGPHCGEPFDCDFKAYCWKHLPEDNVFSIGSMRGKEWELYDQGIHKLEDIPEDFPLSENHRLHLELIRKGGELFESDEMRSFINSLEFPLYFFDFETIGAAVPIFDNSKPYQQIPFQYSLHVLEKPGAELIHVEFLPEPEGDPRPELVNRLISDLGTRGSILTWNMGFEKGKINDLAAVFPSYTAELQAINERITDLMIPFKSRWYYTSDMNNSASIKSVLPALLPELSYKNLEIGDGGTASETFLAMLEGRFEGDYEKTREALLKYCEMDTLAMVKIYLLIINKLNLSD